MRNETIGVLDLRRNLSALLETTQRRPLMVHRYGSPWVCVVSDAQWQQQVVLLDFNPQSHPLAMLLRLQQQEMPLVESGRCCLRRSHAHCCWRACMASTISRSCMSRYCIIGSGTGSWRAPMG